MYDQWSNKQIYPYRADDIYQNSIQTNTSSIFLIENKLIKKSDSRYIENMHELSEQWTA